jgi:hypothetical protein
MALEILTYGKTYAAIEHAEKGSFTLLQLSKKKQEFVISKSKQTNTFNTIVEQVKGQQHLFLIVNDEQVLSKKVENANAESLSIVRAAFPNISISDFYYEVFTIQTGSFVSIARKEVVDVIISKYKEVGVFVIDFSLGNIAIKNLQDFISNETIYSSNAKIDFENKTVKEFKKTSVSKEAYSINDLEVSNDEVLALGGIISYYSKNSSSSISKDLKEAYSQKRFFDIGLKVGLGFLLTILLINFLFFSSYRDQVGSLTGELQWSETYKKQLNTLQEQVTQKKQLVKSVNSASNSKLSKYIDEIGFSVPNTILLTQMEYQPKEGIQKSGKKLLFKKNTIIIKGTSKVHENFSKWISVLEKTLWIEYVSIKVYGKGKKTNSIANFEFIITTNER